MRQRELLVERFISGEEASTSACLPATHASLPAEPPLLPLHPLPVGAPLRPEECHHRDAVPAAPLHHPEEGAYRGVEREGG